MKDIKDFIIENEVNETEVYGAGSMDVGGGASPYDYSAACLIAAGKDPRKMRSTMVDPIDHDTLNRVYTRIECIEKGYIYIRDLGELQNAEKSYRSLMKHNPKLLETLTKELRSQNIKVYTDLTKFIRRHADLEDMYRNSVASSYTANFRLVCDYIYTNK